MHTCIYNIYGPIHSILHSSTFGTYHHNELTPLQKSLCACFYAKRLQKRKKLLLKTNHMLFDPLLDRIHTSSSRPSKVTPNFTFRNILHVLMTTHWVSKQITHHQLLIRSSQ